MQVCNFTRSNVSEKEKNMVKNNEEEILRTANMIVQDAPEIKNNELAKTLSKIFPSMDYQEASKLVLRLRSAAR